MKDREPFSETVEKLLARHDLSSVLLQVRLRRRWADVVGPLLTANSRPTALRNGLLTVSVRTHAWAQELQLRKPELLDGIAVLLGEGIVRDIRFEAGRMRAETPRTDPGPAPEPPDLPPGPEPLEDPLLNDVRDPELRAILRSIARKAASRGAPRRR